MSRDAFGPTLRRQRLRQGIALEQIACEMHVDVALLAALEVNDFSAWPSGIYARAYVRQYARIVGLDAEETVDEFCRHFAQGDRRARPRILEQAAIIGHETTWTDDLPEQLHGVDRRGAAADVSPRQRPAPQPSPLSMMLARVRRAFGRA